MRVGFNPNKDKIKEKSEYTHQIVIPVYIPNQEGYFKDSFKIFKLCITSLLDTVHHKTFVTIVDNGSALEIKAYINELYKQKQIHELIQTENIGKLNAIIKGLVGNDIELITIADADVLFLPNWQLETTKIFLNVPKAGVVGIVPQFKMYETNCGNVLFDNFFNKKMRFSKVKNPDALVRFYDSIGWDRAYNQDYLKYNLSLELSKDLKVLIGSGHFVATYKKELFKEITSFIGFKLGGISEAYLDKVPLEKGCWRLTTQDNYAYHMGNTFEEWMNVSRNINAGIQNLKPTFHVNRKVNGLSYFVKNKLFVKFISSSLLNKLFLKFKGLPNTIANKY